MNSKECKIFLKKENIRKKKIYKKSFLLNKID